MTRDPIRIPVTEATQSGEARRTAAAMAEALGFDEVTRGNVAIAVTELATNLVRHATGGEIVLRSLPPANCCGLEILVLDRGPGIANVDRAMRDGFSTGTTSGNGLGAVRRLSTAMSVFSTPGHGTATVVQFGPADPDALAGLGWVCLPLRGETACGDACDVADLGGGRTAVLVADGLGHGVQAAEASRKAVQIFRDAPGLGGPRLIERLHAALRGTRGAAVSVAQVDRGRGEVRFTGVGNVAGRLLAPGVAARGMVGHNGTVGVETRRVQEFVYPWPAGGVMVLHTDGLASHWRLDAYPGLANRHASLIAGVLYRDFRRERDDVTVLVLGERGVA